MGVKSKGFMKMMLNHMKKARYIKTQKTGKGSQFGYILPEMMKPQAPGVKFPWPMPPTAPSLAQHQAEASPETPQQAA